MSYVPIEELLDKTESIYKLTILAARRALSLSEGAPKLVPTTLKKISTIALEEMRAGKIGYKAKEEGRKDESE